MTAPPTVLYLAETLMPSIGGIETFSRALLPRLKARGYDIHAMTDDLAGTLPATELTDGITYHRLPLRKALEQKDPALLLENIARVRRLWGEIAPSLVHLNFSGPIAFYSLRARAGAAPMVTTLHGPIGQLRSGAGTLLGNLLGTSHWVVANSRAVLADARATAPDVTARSSVIYCGVEPGECPEPADCGNAPHLLCIGRLIPEKGMDLAIDAFAAIRARFPDARLTMAGDGVERSALERRAAGLGIADAVDFIGWVAPDRVPALMASATLVVMPSRWEEPFGLVAVEAALRGKAVLATAVGGLREAVEDGVTGRLVPADADALAGAAIDMLSDRAALSAMGLRGRARAVGLFSLEASADAIGALYRRVMSAQ